MDISCEGDAPGVEGVCALEGNVWDHGARSFGDDDDDAEFANEVGARDMHHSETSTFSLNSLNSSEMNLDNFIENELQDGDGVMSVGDGNNAHGSPFAAPYASKKDLTSMKYWSCGFREINRILIMMTPLADQRQELFVRFQVQELTHFDLYCSYLIINCKEGTFRCEEDSMTFVFGDEMFLVAIQIMRAFYHRDGVVMGVFDSEFCKVLFERFIFEDKG